MKKENRKNMQTKETDTHVVHCAYKKPEEERKKTEM